jgi:hypothetical protein
MDRTYADLSGLIFVQLAKRLWVDFIHLSLSSNHDAVAWSGCGMQLGGLDPVSQETTTPAND